MTYRNVCCSQRGLGSAAGSDLVNLHCGALWWSGWATVWRCFLITGAGQWWNRLLRRWAPCCRRCWKSNWVICQQSHTGNAPYVTGRFRRLLRSCHSSESGLCGFVIVIAFRDPLPRLKSRLSGSPCVLMFRILVAQILPDAYMSTENLLYNHIGLAYMFFSCKWAPSAPQFSFMLMLSGCKQIL